ncbi:glycosyltransferase family 2 protein [Timonella senegalensis]|uniref:glycosyltransferase family 2 protein n=1 Tax=Timonella senegalensis TaxID=1465825 RepID=UPI0028AB9476|nr:glycosyltransferase family 2 protein [Timonella senegalensis]
MPQPLVSVVIPAKDMEDYLGDALSCLLIQGIDPGQLEVIVVNDGSTDHTARVASSFADRLPLLTVLENATSQGVSRARNRGIEAATGGALCFLDPDDWYGPRYLRTCLDALNGLDLDFVRTDHTRQTGRSREIRRAPEFRRARVLHPLDSVAEPDRSTMLDYPFPCTGLFSARLRERGELHFSAECATAEDRELMWRLHLTCERYGVISEPGFFYRRGVPGSLTAAVTRRQLGFLDAFALIFSTILATPISPAAVTLGVTEDGLLIKASRQFLAIAHFQLVRFAEAESRGGEPALVDELALRTWDMVANRPYVARAFAVLNEERADSLNTMFARVAGGVHRAHA